METEIQPLEKLSHDEILLLDRDFENAAMSVRLVYVTDQLPGITRMKKGNGFVYKDANGKNLVNGQLDRIKKLAIPPAWKRVWICPKENGHLQATGIDALNRKQYRYHPLWNKARSETKFHKMYEFGKRLPVLRQRLKKDLERKMLDQSKVVATIINIMELTYIRVGNEEYEKKYGSRGITTLCDENVKIKGEEIQFSFTGKKKVRQSIAIRNRRLARIVKQCRDIPGSELFQYYDQDGNPQPIDSGMVNDYLKDAFGTEVTAKDFRTWAGTLNLITCLRKLNPPLTLNHSKANVNFALDEVSRKLGNTRAVCRNYYVHPGIVQAYLNGDLATIIHASRKSNSGYASVEKILMRILRSMNSNRAKNGN